MNNVIKQMRSFCTGSLFRRYLTYLVAFLLTGWGQTELFAQVCSLDITLNSQADVDNFQDDYGPCTIVTGIIRIEGGANNLDGLSGLTSIENLIITDNHSLLNLNGLSNLTTVEGTLYIEWNRYLANIDGLSNLTTVGYLGIYESPELTNLNGLSSLISIGENLGIVETGITNLNGLSNLTRIEGYLSIDENHNLTNLNGLSNLTYVGGNLKVIRNDQLSTCCGLLDLFYGGTVGGNIRMEDNTGNCNNNGADITPAACIAPYVLVATDDDLEFDECIAHYGGIGIMSAGDWAEIEDDAQVTATGTFVIAPRVTVDKSSSVTNLFYGQAAPDLPAFRSNNASGGEDVDVDDDETVVLTENIYDDIHVDDDATIIFSGHSSVYIDELETEDDVTILFDQCTNLMINKKMELGKDGRFNTINTKDVTVFAEDDITIKRRNVVYGTFYSQEKFYTQAASSSRTTKLHGLFIGEEIEANEHGEYWAQSFDANCGSSPAITVNGQPTIHDVVKAAPIENMEHVVFKGAGAKTVFTLYPNPANNTIHLSMSGLLGKEARIRIFNMQGALMMEKSYLRLDDGEISFNVNQYTAGIYTLLIVVDGKRPLTKKFVVQR